MKTKKLNVILLFMVILCLTTVSAKRTVKAEENDSFRNVSGVNFEYMDDPYAGESYSYPIVRMHWNVGWAGSSEMISRENYSFYWSDVGTGKILTDTDIFEKGKEYSLSLVLPCEFDQYSSFNKEEYNHYIYEDDFVGSVGDVTFAKENYTVENNKIIIKDLYSKVCIDRPEDKIRIHCIDFRNISTKLYEGQDTNTFSPWIGYEETPIYINGSQKVEKGSVLDKNLHWSLWWVKLDYDEVTNQFTLASPADTSFGWWKLDFKEVEPDTYYGLVMILRWEQYKNGPEIVLDANGLEYEGPNNFIFIPMVNGEGMNQYCETTFWGGPWGGGIDDENDPDSEYVGYSLMAGVFAITQSLPIDANIPPEETNAPTDTPSSSPNAFPSAAPTNEPNTSSNINPSVSKSPVPIQTTEPNHVSVPNVKKIKSVKATSGKKKLIFKWKKSSGVSGYQVQISTKKNFKGAEKISISKSKNTYTKKGLKAKKKYYIRIRAYKTYKDANKKTQKAYGKWMSINKKTK